MRPSMLSAVLAMTLVFQPYASFAGSRPPASPSGFAAPPTDDQIRDRLREICSALVEEEDKLSPAVAKSRCGCYANGVTKAMSPAELDEMRVTGKFAPGAQPKAKKFMATCKIKS